jgi:hypothetical protein
MRVIGNYEEVALLPVQSVIERVEPEKAPPPGEKEFHSKDTNPASTAPLPQEVPLQNTPPHVPHAPLKTSEARTTLKPIAPQFHEMKALLAQKDETVNRYGNCKPAVGHHKQNARAPLTSNAHNRVFPSAEKDSSRELSPEKTIHYSSAHRWEKEIIQRKKKRED